MKLLNQALILVFLIQFMACSPPSGGDHYSIAYDLYTTHPDSALHHINRYIESHDDDPNGYYFKAYLLTTLNHLNGAIVNYELASKMYLSSRNMEKYYEVVENIGNVYYRGGQYQSALDAYRAIPADQRDHELKYNMAIAHREHGDVVESLDLLLSLKNYAMEIKDMVLLNELYNETGILYFKIGKYRDAINYYDGAIAIAEEMNLDKKWQAYNNKANAFLKEGDTLRAKLNFIEALNSEEPGANHVPTLRRLGDIAFAENEYAQAVKYYQRLTAMNVPSKDFDEKIHSLGQLNLIYAIRGQLDSSKLYNQLLVQEALMQSQLVENLNQSSIELQIDLTEAKYQNELLENNQRDLLMYRLLIGGLIFLLVFVAIMIYQGWASNYYNKLIKRENSQLRETLRDLQSSRQKV